MRLSLRLASAATLATLTWSAATDAQAQAYGRWRLPSTPAQAFGVGYGPGHHAPVVRVPGYQTPPAPRIVIVSRCETPFVPAAYRPIGGCGFSACGPACSIGGECYGSEQGTGAELELTPESALPAPDAAAPADVSAQRSSGPFATPVRAAAPATWRRPW